MKIINPGRVIWLAIFLLVTLTGEQLLAQPNLKKLEYAFDGDPGIGNATVINLPASPNVDNTFSFDASALANGIHILRYRIMDVNNQWSLTQTVSFLKLGGTSTGTLTLKKLEYAFDNDPGFGNGTAINLLATQTVDSVFTIDVSNLSNGIHKLFFRVQDNDNKWSLTQAASIIRFPGDNNGSNIVKAEYFLDTDPGFGNGTALPVKQGNNITDTFSFVIPDNGKDKRMLHIRTQDNSGAWSLYYSQLVDVDKCAGKTKADFVIVRYADRFAFIDSSKNNTEKKYLWNFDGLGTDTVANPTFDFPRGNHKITLITGEGCRKDTVQKTLYTTLENYYPNKGMSGADLAMRFFGGSLDSNVTVELIKGSTVLRPYKRMSKEFKQLVALFDLHTAPGGNYNVHLKYKDGFDTTIVNGLFVDAVFAEPDIDISLDGPALLRRNNEWTYYTITVTNRSNSLAKGVPFWVMIPNNIEYKIDSKILAPPNSFYPVKDSLPEYIPVDSIEGTSLAGRAYYIIAPFINANETFQFRFRLRSPLPTANFSIHYGTDLPLFGSPLKYLWSDCFDDVVFLTWNIIGLSGAIPTGGVAEVVALSVDGISALGDLFVDNAVDIANGEFSGYSFMQSLGSAVLSATGLAAVKRAGTAALAVKQIFKTFSSGTSMFSNLNNFFSSAGGNDCWKSADKLKRLKDKAKKANLRATASIDPNQITGPNGYGNDRYVNGYEKYTYLVEFENLPAATAAAQKVFVTDTLDKTKYDMSSFELGSFRIGDSVYSVPASRRSYTTTIDLRPRKNMLVRYSAQIDTATGILNYSFITLNPVTKGNFDEGSADGFLPPNTSHPAGYGSVSFSVSLLPNVAHNQVMSSRASIVFDKNAAIITNTWSNKIDKAEPAVLLPGTKLRNDTTIVLKFTGTDNGSGIQGYGILCSTNGGKIRYLGTVRVDSAVITGSYDSSYNFYVMPIDNVSNVGDSAKASIKFMLQQAVQGGNMLVYPNPNRGRFTIAFAVPQQQEVGVDIYSVTGQLLATVYKSATNGLVTLSPDLSRLSNGVYIVRVRGSKGLKLQTKIIIQH